MTAYVPVLLLLLVGGGLSLIEGERPTVCGLPSHSANIKGNWNEQKTGKIS